MSDSTSSVSVVIPAHNAEKYLGAAIESVRAQTLAPHEIIVVDDGSTDGTARIAQSFADVKTIFQENSGAAAARNNGAQNARGEFLAFLDADDLWTPQKLEWQIAALQSEHCDMVFGQAQQFISPELSEDERAKIHLPNENIPAIAPGAMLITRADFFRVGLLETSWEVGEFIDWYLKAGDAGLQTHVLPEVVLRRRVHTSNMGVLQKDARGDYVKILKASLDRRRRQAAQK
jgi:glycosyltransferase involved in cell wall biosynthesis